MQAREAVWGQNKSDQRLKKHTTLTLNSDIICVLYCVVIIFIAAVQ